MKIKEKNGTQTLELHPTSPRGGVVTHTNGDHVCMGEYGVAKPGQNLAGMKAIVLDRKNGTFEPLDTGAGTGPESGGLCGGDGPAQVATEAYRESWERTFGARGGIS